MPSAWQGMALPQHCPLESRAPQAIPSVCTLVFLRHAVRVQLRGHASVGCVCLSPAGLDSAAIVWLLFTLP